MNLLKTFQNLFKNMNIIVDWHLFIFFHYFTEIFTFKKLQYKYVIMSIFKELIHLAD
jgi:hypothetical protein